MELKEPKRKKGCNVESQQPFPIFIESEIGISIENWVPIICSGFFNGFGVVIKEAAEMSALHNMGNFGKGSNSRSRPLIMRSNTKLPPFIRERQFMQRNKWSKSGESSGEKPLSVDDEFIAKFMEDIDELNTILDGIPDEVGIPKTTPPKNKDQEVIDILSSDEEIMVHEKSSPEITPVEPKKEKGADEKVESDKLENIAEKINKLEFPDKSTVVLPDSDPDNDDYFHKMNPKMCIDKSALDETLVLTLQEAYFLAYGLGCLQIFDESQHPLDLDKIWNLFCSVENDFHFKYIMYHYFRSKGWVVKPGVKFGGDFLLYKEGQPFYHASYIVVIEVIHKGISINKHDWMSILGVMRMAGTAAKEVLLAQITMPNDIELEKFTEDPQNISRCTVQEVLLRRWMSKHERNMPESY